MPNITMDRFSKKQTQIAQHQTEAFARYPSLWSNMIAEWHQPGPDDRAWLMYSANYLFRTSNIRWAMDPLRLVHRLPQAPVAEFQRDLDKLSFVILTHQHADHLDLDLIRELSHLPLIWVIPDFVLQLIKNKTDIFLNQVIIPKPFQSFNIQGIQITPFDGLHWEKQLNGGDRGVPAMAYLIEFNGKRWLFPGDTRTYDASQLPSFEHLNGLFAHLWLGRGCALQDDPPLADAFCRFCHDLKPQKITLTHLREFGRDPDDYWDEEHAKKLCSKILDFSGNIPASFALMGDSVLL
jgi:L-ascorbate metabolism protein UlaG (beta-lactamase superfamily)